MSDLLPVDDAIRRIVAGVTPLPSEDVPLAEAGGRRLAAPLAARRTQPPFPASAMDGYALRAADAKPGAKLKLVGISAAGHGYGGAVGPGDAVRIFTGAPVPTGADAILIQEQADAPDAATVIPRAAVTAGRYVRPAGLDFSEGAALLPAGRRLGMRELALAGAMGYGAVPVRRRPVVALLATGDELVPPGALPGPDQIVASTGPGLASLVAASGGTAHDLGIVSDVRAATEAAIDRARALPADVLVTLGGASVGDHDFVRDALAARGMALDFWRIAMRPGKPLLFGRLDGMAVLGLPGNPVSSLVCALLFLRPLLDALQGAAPSDPTEPATLAAPLAANDGRQDYLRARIAASHDRGPLVEAFPAQDSSVLSVLAAADCLIVRPPNAPAAPAGAPCRIVRLP
ncbi:MAG TPA: gephyrin-like molybdotransferase Glp [Bauldia sp.]|nr:gephyrin-like molybdotransferase Glp [Bauldia sp.]